MAIAAAVLIGATAAALWYRPAPRPAAPSVASVETHGTAPVATALAIAAAPRLSIVVLPFANLSDDPAQEYLADGITEDLTTDLSRIEDSFVIARNTAFTYKGKAVEVKQIGRELGVRYVLEGSVRSAGNQVRVNSQLVDVESGAHLWADRFDGGTADLFNVENEITGRIARAVRLRMVAAEAGRSTDHPGAIDFILKGRAALTKPVSRAASDEAINLFEQALTLDPNAARAKIGLASALISRVLDELSSSVASDLRRADQLLSGALEAMPNSGWAHYVRGQLLRAQGRCNDAIPEYEAAIALDHNSAPSYAWLGWCKFLVGEPDKTVALEKQAILLSPQDRSIAAWQGRIGMVHLLQGQTDEAISWLEKARSGYADRPGGDPIYVHAWLASAYALKGNIERARPELEEAWNRGFHRTMAGFDREGWYANAKVRSLAEASYFIGLRKAGMPEQ
jgi:TolB-like protein